MKRRPRGPRTHNARLHEERELERRRRAQAKRNPPPPAEPIGDDLDPDGGSTLYHVEGFDQLDLGSVE